MLTEMCVCGSGLSHFFCFGRPFACNAIGFVCVLCAVLIIAIAAPAAGYHPQSNSVFVIFLLPFARM